ncbi:MAG: DoxX family protein [bacterium]
MFNTTFAKASLFFARVALGWMMFYAGITKILDSDWTAEGFLRGAKTFSAFYNWLVQPNVMPTINFINEWGLTLLGISLIFGIAVRLSSILGAALMLLYYFPILQFPYPNAHSFIVDEHIIYISVLVLFTAVRAGRIWGLENWCANLKICKSYSRFHKKWIG